MARVADNQSLGGSKKCGHDGRCEGAHLGKRGELLIEQPHKFRLVQTVDESPHERAEIGGGRGDGISVSGHIRQQQARDSAGGAARRVIHVPAALRVAKRFAVDPGVQPAHFHAARGELASAPHFHAGHLLR